MSVEADLVELLSADANVDSVVAGRIYAQVAPEAAAMPCIVYRMMADGGERTLSGHIVGQEWRAELWLLANDYPTIIQLKSAVLGVSGQGNGDILRLYITEGPDGYEFEDRLYSKALTVEIIR